MSIAPLVQGRPVIRSTAFALAALALAACAEERPQSVRTPGLDTGITSSSGGGTRALGNDPNIGVRTRTSP